MEIARQFVYVIAAPSTTKVGRARNPSERVRQLQGGCADPLTVCMTFGPMPTLEAAAVERFAHALLAAMRLQGEWFDVSAAQGIEAVRKALKLIAAGEDVPKRKPRKYGPEGRNYPRKIRCNN